jgi:surface polysaccharide O-acyltransferase-like enzyme
MSVRTSSSRVHLVDLLRLVALLQMVNGHTLDAVVAPEQMHGPGFAVYDFLRGLVSVAFMLASGVAFHLTTIARIETGALAREATVKRVRRMIEIIAIGYLLRFPLGGWDADPGVVQRSWDRFAQIDVLQLIGVSLLVLEVVVHVARDRRRAEIATGVLAMIVLAVAPLTETIVADRPLGYLTAWLGDARGSIFPFFPWSSYVFFGAVLGAIAFPAGGRTPARRTFFSLATLTAIVSLATFVMWRSPISLWNESMSYGTMPAFFVEKLAWVLGILAVLAPLVAQIRDLPKPIAALAQETLPIYVFHLLALHFPPLMFAVRLGHDLTLHEGFVVSAGMVILSCAAGLAWPRLSPIARRRAPARTVVATPETAS